MARHVSHGGNALTWASVRKDTLTTALHRHLAPGLGAS